MLKLFMKLHHETLIVILLFASYFLHFANNHFFDDVYTLTALLCLSYWAVERERIAYPKAWPWLLGFYTCYLAVVFIHQFATWQWHYHDYLEVIRFLWSIPIFVYLYHKRVAWVKWFAAIVSLAPIVGYIAAHFLWPGFSQWGRVTIQSTNPLEFGYLASLSSLFCFIYLINWKNLSLGKLQLFFLVIGAIVGMFLALEAASKTGWVPFGIGLIYVLWRHSPGKMLNRGLLTLVTILCLFLGLYFGSSIFHDRMFGAFQELQEFNTAAIAQGRFDSSSFNSRWTFWRIGLYYFQHAPIFGWGDRGFTSLMNDPALRQFASPWSIEFCYQAQFHSEWVTQAVRYGFFGIMGTAFIFVLPLIILREGSYSADNETQVLAEVGLAFLLTQFVASFTGEILNIKDAVFFYSMILTLTMSWILSKTSKDPQSPRSLIA